MRVVLTGAGNPYGQAIADALVAAGHSVRLFGVGADVASKWGESVQWYPGDISTIGSIEPVLAEREVLVHAACLDAPGKDKIAHAMHIERGTLSCRYGAERELMDQFIHVTPAEPGRAFGLVQQQAVATAKGCKIHTDIVQAGHPEQAGLAVAELLTTIEHPGRYPGRETDAWAA